MSSKSKYQKQVDIEAVSLGTTTPKSVIAQQDEIIDDISVLLDGLKDTAVAINVELIGQNQDLQIIDEEVDEANSSISGANKKIDKLMNKGCKCQIYVIIGLLIITLILLAVLLS